MESTSAPLLDPAAPLDAPLKHPRAITKHTLSPARWWVLFLFSFNTLLQVRNRVAGVCSYQSRPRCCCARSRALPHPLPHPPTSQGWYWNIPGPIFDSYDTLLGIDAPGVQLLINWGPIGYIVAAIPTAYLLDSGDGVKRSVLLSISLVLVGALLRLVARTSDTWSVVLIHISYILNDFSGPVAMAAVSRLAQSWFPLEERALATAIGAEANGLGGSISFFVGPMFMTADATIGGLMNYSAWGWSGGWKCHLYVCRPLV